MFHKNGMSPKTNGTVFYSLLYLNSRRAFNGLKHMYSVISVIVDSLLANTKNRESTRSWTARVQFHPPSLGRGPWISLARYMERALMHWKRALYVYPIGVPLQRLFVNGFRYGALD